MSRNKKIISVINDYSCLYNKCSEFLYQPIDHVEAFGIRRENFNRIMSTKEGKQLKQSIAYNYKYVIQEPLHEHRNDMAAKFQNRVDYVNISAYGIGKVKVEGQPSEDDEEAE